MPFSDSLASAQRARALGRDLGARARAPRRGSSARGTTASSAPSRYASAAADRLARVEHAPDLLDREHAQQVRRRAERAAVDLGQAEGRVVGGEDDVARADDADAAAEARSRAPRRSPAPGSRGSPRRRRSSPGSPAVMRRDVARELLDVDAGAEAAPSAARSTTLTAGSRPSAVMVVARASASRRCRRRSRADGRAGPRRCGRRRWCARTRWRPPI